MFQLDRNNRDIFFSNNPFPAIISCIFQKRFSLPSITHYTTKRHICFIITQSNLLTRLPKSPILPKPITSLRDSILSITKKYVGRPVFSSYNRTVTDAGLKVLHMSMREMVVNLYWKNLQLFRNFADSNNKASLIISAGSFKLYYQSWPSYLVPP